MKAWDVPPRLAVFDLDGTLVDAFGDIGAAVNHMLRAAGRPEADLEQVKKSVGRGAKVLVAEMLGTTDEAEIMRNLAVFGQHYMANICKLAYLYDGAVEMLERLRRSGIQIAVASNKPHPLTVKTLELLGLAGLVDFCFGESDQFPRKPAPDVLNHIMGLARVSAQETVMVGDSEVDIAFASAAGVGSVAVTYGQMSADEAARSGATAVIHSLLDLPRILGVDGV